MSEEMSTADIAGRDDRAEPEGREQPVSELSTAGDAQDSASRPSTEPADATTATADRRSALLVAGDSDRFQARWGDVQTHFVDAPREAVQDADTLVAELMQHLAETFARERDSLEQQWTRGEDVSTEDLRVALTRYRSFFDRLLEA
jgi:hypothetical protein